MFVGTKVDPLRMFIFEQFVYEQNVFLISFDISKKCECICNDFIHVLEVELIAHKKILFAAAKLKW